MNKEFIKKMLKAEMLKYQAIKEILPDNLKNKVEDLEKGAAEFVKELALEMLTENMGKSCSTEHAVGADDRKQARKVEVDFS